MNSPKSKISPSSPEASKRLSKVRQNNTLAEMRLRRVPHGRGLRCRVGIKLLNKQCRLEDLGWAVVRVWEHEEPTETADRICAALEKKR